MYVCGVFILSFAVAISIKSNLGVTPINSIPYAIALITHIDVGLSSILFCSYICSNTNFGQILSSKKALATS